jgi:hypothetical protein
VVTIYVEGGGDAASLKAQCRRAFKEFLEKAGFQGKMPSVIAMGARGAAFEGFKAAHKVSAIDAFVMLLVDSEEIPATKQPWTHLKSRDGWDKPSGATDDQAQLMVVCMETWLMSDPDAFEIHFGKDFKKAKLPEADLERRSKQDVYDAIEAATVTARPKGKYGKAKDSFELLRRINPEKLKSRCWWADRFLAALKTHC